ncbi:MAG: transcription antitermination factor NusB [Chloroflexi bacterium]|jgi:N utilization substance protein B|nr:transcription antitermination factor NusB [Chloroflexota bacterium]MBT3669385.1 transcription antitermination factor NusB [Chloroflexota bacterium]MBT4002314.1 transcription antitermination factor NusB [Chloroflexota bacterium]MBT4304596.1 transcription antitermination factor NusB [Chloroflexota bacterium]MBT4534063.1 transcription antitermination factor NusB [Chloroflexota bacterium]
MKSRTKARGVALQALYEIDMTDHGIGIILEERFSKTPLEPKLVDFTYEIVKGIVPIREQLDSFIAEHAPAWPIDQVSIIDRNIIRIALWEIAVFEETPVKVAINEAVELAKVYGSDSTPRFVNGVLGSLANHENEITLAIKKILLEIGKK